MYLIAFNIVGFLYYSLVPSVYQAGFVNQLCLADNYCF